MTPRPLAKLLLSLLLPSVLLGGTTDAVSVGKVPPEFVGGPWLNAPAPLTLAGLRGKVVIVNFWVYSCINCHNSLPTLSSWYGKYHDQGLEIVGVHTPEFESDKPTDSVQASLKADGVTWPIVQDNARTNWNAWGIHSWPTFIVIDRQGNVRASHVGEISSRFPGAIPGLDATLRSLLAEK